MTSPVASFEVLPATYIPDVNLLRPTLESAICNPLTREPFLEEVDEVIQAIDDFIAGNSERYYAVAQTSGGVLLGVMGLQTPCEPMQAFAVTPQPRELINAYVSKESRGLGVGRTLVEHLEAKAVADNDTEVILNSGPRYMRSGWPFWRAVYGEPVGVLKDFYGPRFDAMVWQKILAETE